jgi:ribosome maturation factor RimP
MGNLVEAFERVSNALPHEDGFRDLEIVAQRANRHGRATDLTLVVDRPGGVDMALCERISARLNAALESETDLYTLAVESAGLDRPLTRPGDYTRFRDANVRIITTILVGGAKTHRGKLLDVRGTNVILETAAGELPLPLEIIKSANIDYDIRADLKRAKLERRNQ